MANTAWTSWWGGNKSSGLGSMAYMFYVSDDGGITTSARNQSYGIRPVINLKGDIQISGTGTSTDPFVVKE